MAVIYGSLVCLLIIIAILLFSGFRSIHVYAFLALLVCLFVAISYYVLKLGDLEQATDSASKQD